MLAMDRPLIALKPNPLRESYAMRMRSPTPALPDSQASERLLKQRLAKENDTRQ
ncbi:MAG: hypothetical protein WB624_18835 [Xanthobacteraceae bacterium]|jgi:hypothetical protein